MDSLLGSLLYNKIVFIIGLANSGGDLRLEQGHEEKTQWNRHIPLL